MKEIELKNPCPFCGNKAEIRKIQYQLFPESRIRSTFKPRCSNTNCVAYGLDFRYDTPEEAAEAWDHRASPTEIIKQETDMICSFCEKKLTECARPLFKGKGDVIMCCECFKNFATKFFLKICDKIGGI